MYGSTLGRPAICHVERVRVCLAHMLVASTTLRYIQRVDAAHRTSALTRLLRPPLAFPANPPPPLQMRQRVHAMRHALHAGVSGMGAGGSGTHSGSSSSGSSGIIGVRKQDAGRVNTADRNRGRQVGAPAAVEVEEGEETAGSPGSGVDGGRPVGHRMQQQQQQQEQPPLWADVVAVNATLYALVKAVDRATATARAVLQYNERRRDRGHGLQDGAGWW